MTDMITITATKAKFPHNLADEYLDLKRRKAELVKEEKALKDALLAAVKIGDAIEGNFGRVKIVETPAGYVLDPKAAREMLEDLGQEEPLKYRAASLRFDVRARVAG